MTTKNFRHSGIVTKDLNKSLFFYNKLLKLKIIKIIEEDTAIMTSLLKIKNCKLKTIKLGLKNKIFIELLYFDQTQKKTSNIKINSPGLTHISLTVENLEQLYKKFKKNKIKFLSKPQVSSDKKVKLVFCKSPENIFIELVEIL